MRDMEASRTGVSVQRGMRAERRRAGTAARGQSQAWRWLGDGQDLVVALEDEAAEAGAETISAVVEALIHLGEVDAPGAVDRGQVA